MIESSCGSFPRQNVLRHGHFCEILFPTMTKHTRSWLWSLIFSASRMKFAAKGDPNRKIFMYYVKASACYLTVYILVSNVWLHMYV